jgi:hypothetical protein
LRIWIASRARPNEDDVVDSWNCHHHHHQSSSLPVLSRSTKLPTDDGFPACISPPPFPHSCAIICLFLFCHSFFWEISRLYAHKHACTYSRLVCLAFTFNEMKVGLGSI